MIGHDIISRMHFDRLHKTTEEIASAGEAESRLDELCAAAKLEKKQK